MMQLLYNNNSPERDNALYCLLNNVLEYVMNKLIINDFPYIKANNKSIGHRSSIFGVGINDSDYVTQPTVDGKRFQCPYYTTWKSMIERCYSDKALKKRPTYIGCTVNPIWHSFMAFRAWMIQQDWKGKCLDKDILVFGNKVYAPETCLFVSDNINTMLLDSPSRRGKYPLGITFNKISNKFIAQICTNKRKNRHLGYFNTPEEAHYAASKAKAEHIKTVAMAQPEPIRSGLLRHADLFNQVAADIIAAEGQKVSRVDTAMVT